MKKLLSLTLAGVLALSLFGCSNSNAGASTPADETSTAPAAGSAAPETSPDPPRPSPSPAWTPAARRPSWRSPMIPSASPFWTWRAWTFWTPWVWRRVRVVGSAQTSLEYLQSYVTDENVSNLGTIKEADPGGRHGLRA